MKRTKKWLCLLLAVWMTAGPATAVRAAGPGEEDEDKTLAPYFFIENTDPAIDRFSLKETNVETTINGVIAETRVTQTYANEGENPINGSYVFPASTRVSIHGMKMQIGDTVVTAQIKEKEEAKEEFEKAKEAGKSASLLEQKRPNAFNMSVANIMPGDLVNIELHYTELIVPTEGIYQFVFPTVVGPRYVSPNQEPDEEGGQIDPWAGVPYLQDGEAPPGAYNISVKLSSGVPITGISSKSHDIKVTQSGETSAQAELSNPGDYAGNRDFILDYKLTGEAVTSGLMLHRAEAENFFMLMVQPPERVELEAIPPREYIFVLDVSGSMSGYPLDTAKDLIKNLVTNLRETDTFNVILFSGAAAQMAPESIPATADNIRLAAELIDQQSGGGGTELAPAIRDALSVSKTTDSARSIIVMTDGYIGGEQEIFALIRKNLGTASFFSFGIGDSVNRYLIDGIAKTGSGEAFVVTDPEDAGIMAERFRSYIQSPVLTDIQVIYSGFEVYDIEPDTLPTLFAEKPIVLFGKWRGDPSGTIRITGKTGTGDFQQILPVAGIEPQAENHAIPYLWARTRVERLTDYGLTTDESTARQEVTGIGLKYSMMTPYTSFIAVIDTIRNPEADSTDIEQPLPLPEHVSNLAVGGYTSGAEPGTWILLTGLLLLVSVNTLHNKRRNAYDSMLK